MNRQRLVAGAATVLVKLLASTLRWEFRDEAGYLKRPQGSPIILAAWHNRILMLPVLFDWLFKRRYPTCVLTSPSRDGALLAHFVGNCGISAVQGSSSRGGAKALLQLHKLLRAGVDVVVTPDGPRGPVYVASPGLFQLAERSGVPLVAARVEYESFWELRSWDRFRIPKPFSKMTITFLAPVRLRVGDEARVGEILSS